MSSNLISFNGEYCEYHGGEKEEQGLEIGGYKLTFISDLVASYLFEKSKNLLNRTTYHGIYRNDNLVVFKGNKRVQEIKDRLSEFNQALEKAAGNQHLQFTTEIWTSDTKLPPYMNKDKVKIATKNPFSWIWKWSGPLRRTFNF